MTDIRELELEILREEIAQLRRDLGLAEGLLNDIEDRTDLPADLWHRIDTYFKDGAVDMTVADLEKETWPQLDYQDVPGLSDRDPGDETDAS